MNQPTTLGAAYSYAWHLTLVKARILVRTAIEWGKALLAVLTLAAGLVLICIDPDSLDWGFALNMLGVALLGGMGLAASARAKSSEKNDSQEV